MLDWEQSARDLLVLLLMFAVTVELVFTPPASVAAQAKVFMVALRHADDDKIEMILLMDPLKLALHGIKELIETF